MKITKYIYMILLCLGWSGQLFARDPQLIGVVGSPMGPVVCFQLDEGVSLQRATVQPYNMDKGAQEAVQDAENFSNGTYCFIKMPEKVTENKLAYEFVLNLSDGTEFRSSKYETETGRWFDWLGTDVKWTETHTDYPNRGPLIDSSYGYQPEWGVPFNATTYYKAILTCATGYFLFDFPEGNPYDLLHTDYGVATYDSETWSENGHVRFTFTVNGEQKEEAEMYAPGIFAQGTQPSTPGPHIRTFETPINGATTVEMSGDSLGDRDGDIMVFAMPRVYLKADNRKVQTLLNWKNEETINENRAFKYTLMAQSDADATLPITYRLVYGSQYADLSGSTLNVHTMPEDDYIEVEAFQPGNENCKPSDVYRCRFVVSGKKVVAPDENYVLHEDEELDEIIVKGDKNSVGQLSVESGSAKVDKLILQYTFVPGEWNFISFPSNADLSQITNLKELGYDYNTGDKAFYVLEYNTKNRADHPEKTAWTRLAKPSVVAHKGYIMGVSRSADNPDNTPVTVTFTFDNVKLNLSKEQNGTVGVNMDFYQVTPGTRIPVYIKPADGVKGNSLKFDLLFEPEDLTELPMNYDYELEQSRITFNPNRSGIRITLPTSEAAKVLIFDKKDRLVKAVRYVSPYLIDIKDLKKGEYQMLIQYGGAREYKKLTIE